MSTIIHCRLHEEDLIVKLSRSALKFLPIVARNATPKIRFFSGYRRKAINYLDLGCHTGNTVKRFIQICGVSSKIHAIDKDDYSSFIGNTAKFYQVDATKDEFPLQSNTIDMITIVHLIEHIHDVDHMFNEVRRVLKPGGRVYIETPGLRRMLLPSFRVGLRNQAFRNQAINFLDDPTHINLWTLGKLHYTLSSSFEFEKLGVARNRILAFFGPILVLYGLLTGHRTFFSQGLQNMIGANIYAVVRKPLKD